MQLQKIRQLLDENPCLSEAWKAKLLALIEYESERYQVPQKVEIKDFMDFIESHEGKRRKVYMDTMGHPTIGIGFNLDRPDAPKLISEQGIHFGGVLDGTVELSEQAIYTLFTVDVENVLKQVKELVPSFDQQPKDMQLVLVDMCFNLGKGGLSKFKKFLAAVEERNYSRAAAEMIDSRWYSQVGNRSKELVKMVKSLV